jgi:anti-sigma-K factor RskA
MSGDSHADRREDVAAYAIGALEPDEAAELERHLAGCQQCRRDLRWLAPAVSSLGESVERLEPPASLRAELMDTVREEAARPRPPAAPEKPRRFSGFLLRPAIGLAAVALLVAVGLIAYSAGGGGMETVTSRSNSGGSVQASLMRTGDSGTLELTGLHQLPPKRVYQAWVQRGSTMEPSSLFAPRRDGTASAAIPGDLDGARQVLVTIEPRGGSMAPTSRPLVGVPVGS